MALVSTNSHGQPLRRHAVHFSEGPRKALKVSSLAPGTYSLFSAAHNITCCSVRVLPPPPSPPTGASAAAGGGSRGPAAAGDVWDVVFGGVVFRKMAWGLEALLLTQPIVMHAVYASADEGIKVRKLQFSFPCKHA